MAKCEICNKEAVFRFSPDLDIEGLKSCKEHVEEIRMAYTILITLGEKEYQRHINSLKKAITNISTDNKFDSIPPLE
jgi:hypothetical protein